MNTISAAAAFAALMMTAPVYAEDGPPAIYLSFDENIDDSGSPGLKNTAYGDEVKIAPGLRGNALFIGGTKDWLEVPLGKKISLARGFTLEMWVRRDAWTNPYKGGSGWQTVASVGTSFSLAITAPGCPLHKPWALHASVSRYRDDIKESEDANVFSPPGSVGAKAWVHAAMVYDPTSSTLILYMNGKEVDRALGAPLPDLKFRRIHIGTWHKENQAYRGEVDELYLYDYPRPPEAIAMSSRVPEP